MEINREISGDSIDEPTVDQAPNLSYTPSLLVKTGINEGRIAEVAGDEFIIGRHKKCGLKLDDKAISRQHAIITHKQGRFMLRDMGSRWGTKLNGAQIDEVELKLGDQIEIAGNMIVFDLSPRGAQSIEKRDPIRLAITIAIGLAIISLGSVFYFKYRVNQNLSRPGGDVLAKIVNHYDQGILYYNQMDKNPGENRENCIQEMREVIKLDPTGKTRFSRSATRILEGLE